ncbi:hypothetical protein ANCCEY_09197 [Ancylostoma ceylanicum]|uniref:Uncharacterized protein n=2 Tax=Ancylostoma ceylanicum TaxID=53326 RepID=A0A0D6LI01_9BILA|nr:hypothetical protein ANCCEY_09197 [Ancylostoma ceylanicum]EYC24245.1 hypothetical protein Y032_0014g2395 [Ancylostoma ceylanicum]
MFLLALLFALISTSIAQRGQQQGGWQRAVNDVWNTAVHGTRAALQSAAWNAQSGATGWGQQAAWPAAQMAGAQPWGAAQAAANPWASAGLQAAGAAGQWGAAAVQNPWG